MPEYTDEELRNLLERIRTRLPIPRLVHFDVEKRLKQKSMYAVLMEFLKKFLTEDGFASIKHLMYYTDIKEMPKLLQRPGGERQAVAEWRLSLGR